MRKTTTLLEAAVCGRRSVCSSNMPYSITCACEMLHGLRKVLHCWCTTHIYMLSYCRVLFVCVSVCGSGRHAHMC